MRFQFTRRHVIQRGGAVVALAIPGCLSSGEEHSSKTARQQENTPSPTSPESATPTDVPDELRYRVRVGDHGVKEDVASQNLDNLEFSVQVIDPEITNRKTATVVLERKNTGEEILEVGTDPASGPQPRYSSFSGGPPWIVLVPTEAYDLESTEPGCWSPDVDGLTVLSHGGTMALEPGESVKVVYEVWAKPTKDRRCLQPGTYQFTSLFVTWALQIAEAQ